jgi:hypothetical protein
VSGADGVGTGSVAEWRLLALPYDPRLFVRPAAGPRDRREPIARPGRRSGVLKGADLDEVLDIETGATEQPEHLSSAGEELDCPAREVMVNRLDDVFVPGDGRIEWMGNAAKGGLSRLGAWTFVPRTDRRSECPRPSPVFR